MKTLITSLILLSSMQAFSASLDTRICTAVSKTHNFTLRETPEGVEGVFEDNSAVSWGQVRKYKLSGKLVNKLVLEKLTLNAALADRYLINEMVVSMLRARPEFDGEADIHHVIAGEYTHDKLLCQ
ncbi:hypothetical protein [Bdellovibrio sp. HCB337]|uniref:hypothetical protein n=1 Tax=Bdellovibrio sp. HCB337 TaxID=3394358 RepID=UPI0039A5F637